MVAVRHVALGVCLLLVLLLHEGLVVVLDLDVGVGLLDEVHDGRLGWLLVAIDLDLVRELCLTDCGISQIAEMLPSPEGGAHGTHGFRPIHCSLHAWACFIRRSIVEGGVFIYLLLVFELRTALRLLSFEAGVVIPIVHHALLIAINHCNILHVDVQIPVGAVLHPREVVAAVVQVHRYFLVLVPWKRAAILVYFTHCCLAIRRSTHIVRVICLEL